MSAIINSAEVNIWVHIYLLELRFSLNICPGLELLDCMVSLFLVSFCFFNFVFNWRIIALLCCVGFCHIAR